MTRKDYRALASELADNMPDPLDEATKAGYWLAVQAVCKVLRQDNPRFNQRAFEYAVEGYSVNVVDR